MPSKQSRKNRKKTTSRRPSRSIQMKNVEPKEESRFTEMSLKDSKDQVHEMEPAVLTRDENNDSLVDSATNRFNSQREDRIISDAVCDLRRTAITTVMVLVALSVFVISN